MVEKVSSKTTWYWGEILPKIENQRDVGSIMLNYVIKNATITSLAPFWQLLSILTLGIQKIDGTIKKMKMLKVFCTKLKIEQKGPDIGIHSLGPVHDKMKQHRTQHSEDHLNCLFSIILMMWSHSWKVKVLMLVGTIHFPLNTCKWAIVCHIQFNFYANRQTEWLKRIFRKTWFCCCCCCWQLVKVYNKFWSMINETCATSIFLSWTSVPNVSYEWPPVDKQ